jgi:hypothetical protein
VLAAILDNAKGEPKDSKLLPLLPALKDSVAAYKQPLADDDAAAKTLAKADTALGVAREQWLLTYDALAGDLRSLFPRRKAFVDSFFPKVRGAKGSRKRDAGD